MITKQKNGDHFAMQSTPQNLGKLSSETTIGHLCSFFIPPHKIYKKKQTVLYMRASLRLFGMKRAKTYTNGHIILGNKISPFDGANAPLTKLGPHNKKRIFGPKSGFLGPQTRTNFFTPNHVPAMTRKKASYYLCEIVNINHFILRRWLLWQKTD